MVLCKSLFENEPEIKKVKVKRVDAKPLFVIVFLLHQYVHLSCISDRSTCVVIFIYFAIITTLTT